MAIYKGPAVIGMGDLDATEVHKLESVGWLTSDMIKFGINRWHIGVFCLIGNCLCMAIYLALQVFQLTILFTILVDSYISRKIKD